MKYPRRKVSIPCDGCPRNYTGYVVAVEFEGTERAYCTTERGWIQHHIPGDANGPPMACFLCPACLEAGRTFGDRALYHGATKPVLEEGQNFHDLSEIDPKKAN